MRFLPLVSSRLDPALWQHFLDLELAWEGQDGEAWTRAVRAGLAIHAVHLADQAWGDGLVQQALEVLGAGLGPDFLVARARPPGTRLDQSKFLGALESLLEACTKRGVKLALRPAAGATLRLLELLQGVRGDAVGFCWDGWNDDDPEPIADRLHCALGPAEVDLRPLQIQGYRWNYAVPAEDPAAIAPVLEDLRGRFPAVLFPTVMPATALGRPVVPDPDVVLGPGWGGNRLE